MTPEEREVLRSVDFDWASRLSEVWDDPPWDVPGLHDAIRAEFSAKLDAMRAQGVGSSPLGWFVVGDGGTGKTHLLGAFRRKAARRASAFVLVDMTDVRDFWETVLQGYIDSLQQRYEGHLFQHQCILRNLIGRMGPSKPAGDILTILAQRKGEELLRTIQKVLHVLSKAHPAQLSKHQNVVRALVCLNADDFSTSNLAMTWLQGLEIEAEERRAFGFTVAREQPRKIVEALSWLMSLSGPTVLAFDQLDPIVIEHHFRQVARPSPEEQAAAQAIITQIGSGLGALRDVTRNTLVVVSCVEMTWNVLNESTLRSFLDRFEQHPRRLGSVRREAIAEAIVRNRLSLAFEQHNFRPPHETWPFPRESFGGFANSNPREVLKRFADAIRRILGGEPMTPPEISTGKDKNPEPTPPVPAFEALDGRFEAFRKEADPAYLLEEKQEDSRLAPLLQAALECLAHESDLGMGVDAVVDTQFTGGATTSPLHARLRLIFHDEQGREEHFCLRALQLSHGIAFQTRLKAAMTQSGIDRALKFRHLAVIRDHAPPSGPKTAHLVQEFREAGGIFLRPTDDELRTLAPSSS